MSDPISYTKPAVKKTLPDELNPFAKPPRDAGHGILGPWFSKPAAERAEIMKGLEREDTIAAADNVIKFEKPEAS